MRDTDLTDRQWELLEPLLPRRNRLGRPRVDDRRTINRILYVLRTDCRWKDLPAEYSSPVTCWRRLNTWQEQGVWTKVLRVLLGQLHKRGRLKLTHSYLDGSFAPAKRGVLALARPRRVRAPKGK
jgi:transposase